MAIDGIGPLANMGAQIHMQAMDRAGAARGEELDEVTRLRLDTGTPVRVDKSGEADFGDILANALESINGLQATADANATAFVTGEDIPIHELMASMTHAELGVQLTTAVVSKAIAAYQEIWRTEV